MTTPYSTALIVGSGSGLSAAVARRFSQAGMTIALAARRPEKLTDLCQELSARRYACDAADPAQVEALFSAVDGELGPPDVVLYNASYRVRGPLVELAPAEVRKTLEVTAFGAFLVARAAAQRMLAAGRGAILFTGASAGVKGYSQSAPFAMGKFALRGLAQSMARELAPQNIHVAHFVIDGGIRAPGREPPAERPDSLLAPDAIAQSYLDVLSQPRSAWSWELELRPWLERF